MPTKSRRVKERGRRTEETVTLKAVILQRQK
jgi:hypothetical protein